jgi:RimJ/RimL family protein N-acetyltransferase
MSERGMIEIETPRLRLRPWQDADRDALAALNADAEVMRDLGGPLDRAGSDAKLDRFLAAFAQCGFTRWVIEDRAGAFLGYAGNMPARPDHPLGPHVGIGWRLIRSAWGYGYATEAASAALRDGFARCGLTEVLAYTAPENRRSQAVMARLGLLRDPSRDCNWVQDGLTWHGLVWVARAHARPW